MKVANAKQAQEDQDYHRVLCEFLFQLADDELTLGHRDSEWLGLSPDIEGDVAFSSIAQDEVGHAVFYFDLLHELGEKNPDQLAFARPLTERRNATLLERENGDFAYSIVRHYLYDVFDSCRLEAIEQSSYQPLAQGAIKIRREEYYHRLHMSAYLNRLGQAGGEAKKRLEKAIHDIWPEIGGLFCWGEYENKLFEYGIISISVKELQERWIMQVKSTLLKAGLPWPGDWPKVKRDGRKGEHSPDLAKLLSTMSEVYQSDPSARW
ncbi:1,2-phenylacetyl-CoA epoxidase subunit PaaC [Thermoflavimicrobium daqui]|uniref:Phenylacetate-CoA oxygenase subunit PaaI n=1 Tax=Thermoflavimicrobium daqui TaxID=2137476 RepID=A0A364K9H7_9BACL|nr:1,2-phenylacetyl-CoA epoxidase subunit PaaC [Thermoflavimicrobium daqui]RAL26944.1 phenylacetate-CoA oxygenase subunit PaaI [Thermoflavimicrobium daqui]